MIQDLPPTPTGWTRQEIAAWVIALVTFLLGGGAVGNFWLKKYERGEKREQSTFDRERDLNERIARMLTEQDKSIKDRDQRLELMTTERFQMLEDLASVKTLFKQMEMRMKFTSAQANEIKLRFDEARDELAECERRSDLQQSDLANLTRVVESLAVRLNIDPKSLDIGGH